MATASAPDAVADVIKWTKSLEARKRILDLNKNICKNIETVRNVAAQAKKIKPDRESVKTYQKDMESLVQACDDVLSIGKALSVLEKDMNQKLQTLKELRTTEENAIEDFVHKLEILLNLATEYSVKLSNYEKTFSKVAKASSELFAEFNGEHECAKKDTDAKLFKGAATTGTVATTLGIVGFFMGGPLGAAAAAVMTSCVGIGATAIWTDEMRKNVKEFRLATALLQASTNELESISGELTNTREASESLTESVALVIKFHRSRAERQKMVQEIQDLKIRDEERETELRRSKEENLRLSEQNKTMRAFVSGDAATTAKSLEDKEKKIKELERQLLMEKEKGKKIARQLLGTE